MVINIEIIPLLPIEKLETTSSIQFEFLDFYRDNFSLLSRYLVYQMQLSFILNLFLC